MEEVVEEEVEALVVDEDAEAMEEVVVVEVSFFVPFNPLFHLLMELTRPMVGGFTS